MSELKKTASMSSVLPGHNQQQSTGQNIVIRLSIPSQNLQKALRVNTEDSIWSVKCQIIEKMAKGIPDALNYGVYVPPPPSSAAAGGTSNGAEDVYEGKLLDEQKLVGDYHLENNETLEFRLKHKQGLPQQGSKLYQKDNNPKMQKKLMESVRDGKVDEVRTKVGPRIMDPNFQDESGVTPLVQAVLNNDRDMITTLIDLGALIDYRSKSGAFATGGGKAPPVSNAFNSQWLTPMHVASSENKLVALQTLMYFGGSPEVKDSVGILPLAHACHNGHQEIVRWILAWAVVNVRDSSQPTIPIDLEQRDPQDRTYLHLACHSSNQQMIQLLCEYGADVNATIGSTGNTPLHQICAKPISNPQLKDCARILISFGADRDLKNRGGQTASQLALMSGNVDLSDFIKRLQVDHVEEPLSIDQLIESARNQWVNIRKMMSIGLAGGKFGTLNAAPAPAFLSANFGAVRKSPSRESMTSTSETDESTTVAHSGSQSGHNTTRHHDTMRSAGGGASGNTRPSLFSAFGGSGQSYQNIPGPPSGAPPLSAFAPNASISSSAPSIGPGGRKLPPPPPPGNPPSVQFLFNPSSSAGQGQTTGTINTVEILEKLQKIDEEKRKLEAELDRLKKLVASQAQLSSTTSANGNAESASNPTVNLPPQ